MGLGPPRAPTKAGLPQPGKAHAKAKNRSPPMPKPGGKAPMQARVPATSKASSIGSRRAAEERVDPVDGAACTLEQLQDKYDGVYTPDEIQEYWESEMQPAEGAGASEEAPEEEEVGDEEAPPRLAAAKPKGAMKR